MRSLINKLAIVIIALGFVTTAAVAADYDPTKGTITINITDGGGAEAVGNWYLHQGGISGIVPRNGNSGETFQIAPSTYYLEARTTDAYKAYWLKSTNPQAVSAGQTIIFDLVYYTTQEAKEQAQEFAAMQESEEEALVQEEAVTEEEAVEPPVEEETTEEAVTEETTEEESEPEVVIPPAPVITPDVPTWSTPPTTTSAAESEDESFDLGAVTSLAQTGPGLLFLLLPSIFGGIYFASRRKRD